MDSTCASMKKYSVFITKEARADLKGMANYITDALKAPLTAKQYANGIVKEITKMKNYAESLPLASHKSVKIYGMSERRRNYNNHAIIYTVEANTVIIQRIIVEAMIKE